MFTIKNSQLDAFRIPLRIRAREKLFAEFQSKGFKKINESNKNVLVQDDKGRKSSFGYSDKNLLSQLIKPTGVKYNFSYDEEDRINKIELPNKETLKLKYKDDLPNTIKINDSGLDIVYNAKSQVSEIIFSDKKSVRFQYDEDDRLISVINRANETQSFNTTIKDNKLVHQLKDSLGRETLLVMDSMGGIEKIIFPDGTTQEGFYNENLDAEVIKLRNGKTKTIFRGELYPERIEWEDGNFQDITFNDLHQIESVENPSGTISYEYDDEGRPLSESFQGSKLSYVYEGEFIKSINYPSGLVVDYNYNEDDQLQSIIIGDQIINYQYDSSGVLSEIRHPNGLTEQQKNLFFGGLQNSKLVNKLGDVISEQQYSYDDLGRLNAFKNLKNSVITEDWKFEYDNESRLVGARENSTQYDETYRYDAKGNIIKANTQKIEVGRMDEVLLLNDNALEYDKAGNLLRFKDDANRQLNLTFSENNTLKHVQIGNEVWEYWYDSLGRRVGKSNGKEAYKFFWAGDKLLTEEYTKDKIVVAREYIYADNNVPVAFKEGDKIYSLQSDVRGAIIKVHDETGEIVWSASYTAFGKASIGFEKINQPWRLAGQYFDMETGLHYNLTRYYSPHLRSYLSLDPKWLLYGATSYNYAANDPYNKIDSDGKLPDWVNTNNLISIGVGIVAGVVAGAAAVAIAGTIGVSATVVASSLLAIAAIGTVSGFVAGVAESVAGDLLDDKDICLKCAIKSGLAGATFGAVLGPLGKLLGRGLGAMSNKVFQKKSIFTTIKPNPTAGDRIARRTMIKQGRSRAQVEQVIKSAKGFKRVRLKKGDKLFAFTSKAHGKNPKSPYWIDEATFNKLKSKYFKEGKWDSKGVANELGLPSSNTLDDIVSTSVTKDHNAVKAVTTPTEEIISSKNLLTGKMETTTINNTGGGTQVTPSPDSLGPIKSIGYE